MVVSAFQAVEDKRRVIAEKHAKEAKDKRHVQRMREREAAAAEAKLKREAKAQVCLVAVGRVVADCRHLRLWRGFRVRRGL